MFTLAWERHESQQGPEPHHNPSSIKSWLYVVRSHDNATPAVWLLIRIQLAVAESLVRVIVGLIERFLAIEVHGVEFLLLLRGVAAAWSQVVEVFLESVLWGACAIADVTLQLDFERMLRDLRRGPGKEAQNGSNCRKVHFGACRVCRIRG